MLLDRMLDTAVVVFISPFRIQVNGSLLLLHTVWLFSIVTSLSIGAVGLKKMVVTFKNRGAIGSSGFSKMNGATFADCV